MELLYRGFDGLDVSFQGRIDHRFCRALEEAKLSAQKYHRDEFLEWGGIGMLVKESGARGGYAFTARTEAPRAVWFFKKPNPNDPWGIRVSCDSFQLAMHGLGGTRAALINALSSWHVEVPLGAESIGRVDYAMDFLSPDLVLEPSHFVMHSNCSRSDHYEAFERNVRGKSGRVTSVTVGQMPGRQIIVYDKRAEVIAKQKLGWQTIWDASREREGKPPLNHADPSSSQIWRIEVRAGKKLLKDVWSVRTWEDLDAKIGDVFVQSLRAVRYTDPSSDTNRARWPEHPLWKKALDEIAQDLFEMRNFATPNSVKLVQLRAYDQILASQLLGLFIARAALQSVKIDALGEFIISHAKDLASDVSLKPQVFSKKLTRATNRVRVLR